MKGKICSDGDPVTFMHTLTATKIPAGRIFKKFFLLTFLDIKVHTLSELQENVSYRDVIEMASSNP